jgi:hypothetical protein
MLAVNENCTGKGVPFLEVHVLSFNDVSFSSLAHSPSNGAFFLQYRIFFLNGLSLHVDYQYEMEMDDDYHVYTEDFDGTDSDDGGPKGDWNDENIYNDQAEDQEDSPAFASDYTTEGPCGVLPAKATSKDTPSDINHSSTDLLEAVIEVSNPNLVKAFRRSVENVSKLARPGSWN